MFVVVKIMYDVTDSTTVYVRYNDFIYIVSLEHLTPIPNRNGFYYIDDQHLKIRVQ